LLQKLKNNRELLVYSLFNYADKALVFSLPLLLLYFFKDKALYNTVEYIFSISTIAVTVVDMGMKINYFYSYSTAEDKDQLIRNVKSYFDAMVCLYMLLFAAGALVSWIFRLDVSVLLAFIFFRVMFQMISGFFSYHTRLLDKPFNIFLISMTANLATLAVLFVLFWSGTGISATHYFLPQALIVAGYFLFVSRKSLRADVQGWLAYLRKSLGFAWPVILNVFMVTFVNNFGKLYAYKFLSSNEMFQVSYILRIALIIQLAHASALEYLTKKIYVDASRSFNLSIFKKYTGMLMASVLMCIGFTVLFNIYSSYLGLPKLEGQSFLLYIYVILWCFSAYFEAFFNKHNQNIYLLPISLISSGVFLGILFLSPAITIHVISLSMIAYAVTVLLLQWFFIRRLRLIQF
jgi:O-antigen/teichoic acid export membrane protein